MLPAGGTKNRDDEIVLDGRSLTIESTVEVARFKRKVSISPEAMNNVDRARQLVEDAIAAGRTIYGINTGFGDMCRTKISHENIKHLQENLLLSHAVGVGDPFPEEIVRGILLLRANALLRGNSGCRPVVIQKLVDMLNKNVVPVIPCKGSVGASGDLAPLAHASLVLIGRGEAFFDGVRMPGADALKKAGIEPLILDAKEGLALINGTQAMLSAASLALNDAFSLYYHALLAVAMAHEALLGTMSSMDAEIHHARNQKGQIEAAKGIREICKGSEIIDSHKNCSRVQDAYSLRCSPQVLGASLDAFNYVKEILERELNASTDNPLVFEDEDGKAKVLSGGNFHGQPVALASDFLAIAASEIADLLERICARLVDPKLSGLPANLVRDGGLNSGFMILQYVAASLVSENKVLCHPASVDSIPTSSNQEDHVSMGTIAARKAMDVVRNALYVAGISLFMAAQAVEFHRPLKSSPTIEKAIQRIREKVPFVSEDRELRKDVEVIMELVRSERLIDLFRNN